MEITTNGEAVKIVLCVLRFLVGHQSLNIHKRIHLVKSYKCSLCLKVFPQPSGLCTQKYLSPWQSIQVMYFKGFVHFSTFKEAKHSVEKPLDALLESLMLRARVVVGYYILCRWLIFFFVFLSGLSFFCAFNQIICFVIFYFELILILFETLLKKNIWNKNQISSMIASFFLWGILFILARGEGIAFVYLLVCPHRTVLDKCTTSLHPFEIDHVRTRTSW